LFCFVAGLVFITGSSVQAQCVNASSQAIIDTPDPNKVGGTINYTVQIGVPAEGCAVTNCTAVLYLPNGATIQYLSGVSISPGETISCPGDPRCLAGPYSYTIAAADETDPLPPGSPCPPSPFPRPDPTQDTNVVVVAYHQALGTALAVGGGGNEVFSVCGTTSTRVLHPCVTVDKTCEGSLGPGGDITFSGVISNCSPDATLFNVTVSNIVGSASVLVSNIAVLSPGLKFTVTGVSMGSAGCEPVTDTLLVLASDQLGGIWSDTDSATCSNVCHEGECVTRTPGYWFNHLKSTDPNCATLKKAIELNGGRLDLGFICLPTNGVANAETAMRQALSFFPPNTTGYGSLCDARKKLAFHLIAAIANTALFETDPGNCIGYTNDVPVIIPSDLIEQAREAAACDNIAAIRNVTTLLDVFNNSGDAAPMPGAWKPCGLGGAPNRDALRINVFNAAKCGNTSHCATGHACP
jgi:hypothetical protein